MALPAPVSEELIRVHNGTYSFGGRDGYGAGAGTEWAPGDPVLLRREGDATRPVKKSVD